MGDVSGLPKMGTGGLVALQRRQGDSDVDMPALVSPRSTKAMEAAHKQAVDEEATRMEVLDTYRKQEAKYMVYNPDAQYIKFKYRRVVVDWMVEVGEQFRFATTTTHMAIKYLDRLLGTMDVSKARIQLVAMACIFVAAKYDEPDDNLPTLAELNACAENAYTLNLIRDMEAQVLKYLEWNLGVIVPLHFLSLWIHAGCVYPDDRVSGQPVSKRCVKYLLKYVDFFADLCQHEYEFQEYFPSLVAAATIAAGRTALRFQPVWNARLTHLTGLTAEEVFPCYDTLWRTYETNFPSGRSTVRKVSNLAEFTRYRPMSPVSPGTPLNSPLPATPSTPATPLTPATPITPQTPMHNKVELIPCASPESTMYQSVSWSPSPSPGLTYSAPSAPITKYTSELEGEKYTESRDRLRSTSAAKPMSSARYKPYDLQQMYSRRSSGSRYIRAVSSRAL